MKRYLSTLLYRHRFFWLMFLFAVAVKLFFSPFAPFRTDMNSWIGWGNQLVEYGIPNFYSRTAWTDYTPGYFYVLWLVTILQKSLLPDVAGAGLDFVYKLPVIFADLVSGGLIYLIIRSFKRSEDYTPALVISGLYFFNPITTFNGAIWGQADSFHVMLLLFSAYMLICNRIRWSFALFTAACVVKPLSGLLAPMYVYLFFKQKPQEMGWLAGISTLAFLILTFPFWGIAAPLTLFEQLQSSYNLYPYASLNTFNFWGIFGFWIDDTELLLFGIHSRIISYLFLGIWIVLITALLVKTVRKHTISYAIPFIFLYGSMYVLGGVMFMLRMHERYLYHFFPFFLLFVGYLYTRRIVSAFYSGLALYVSLSLLHLANLYYVYVQYLFWDTGVPADNRLYWWVSENTIGLSWISLMLAVLALFYCFTVYRMRMTLLRE